MPAANIGMTTSALFTGMAPPQPLRPFLQWPTALSNLHTGKAATHDYEVTTQLSSRCASTSTIMTVYGLPSDWAQCCVGSSGSDTHPVPSRPIPTTHEQGAPAGACGGRHRRTAVEARLAAAEGDPPAEAAEAPWCSERRRPRTGQSPAEGKRRIVLSWHRPREATDTLLYECRMIWRKRRCQATSPCGPCIWS